MNLTLELSGLNLERLLRAAGECGVRMKNVRRVDGRTMRVVVPAAQKKRMAALCPLSVTRAQSLVASSGSPSESAKPLSRIPSPPAGERYVFFTQKRRGCHA